MTHAPLCEDPHTCDPCASGEPCADLFMHPTCGLVACDVSGLGGRMAG